MSASAPELERIQRWFHASITHEGGGRDGVASELARQLLPAADGRLEDVVLPSNALNSMQRLSIYADMYFERLTDILVEEFPSVRHLLGAQTFADVVKDYLTRHPPAHYSLARLGQALPRFLSQESDGIAESQRQFAAAVATVERTMEDVFDDVQVEPLSFDELEAIPQKHWRRLRLTTVPALRLLTLPYPVNNYISAVREQRNIDIPAASHSFVVVYRCKYRVWRRDLDERQFTLLARLRDEHTLEEAISACAEVPGCDPGALATSLFEWFRTWTAEGFFQKIA